MSRQLCFSAAVAAIGLVLATHAHAVYTADFDGSGSAADFAPFQINNTDDGDPDGTGDNTGFLEVASGDDFLRVHASPPAIGSGAGVNQLRYQVAPLNALDPGIAIPVGSSTDGVRVEARLSVRIEEIVGGDGVGGAQQGILENPYVQFGFTEYDPLAGAADYASKVLVQIDPAFRAGTPAQPHHLYLGYTTENAGGGTTSVSGAPYNMPGDAFSPGDVVELVVTQTEAKLIYNGTDFGFASLPANFFTDNFAAGNTLIPFFGLIRGPALEDNDVISAGFDDINAYNNIVVPEPSSFAILMVAGVMGGAYRSQRRTKNSRTFE
jgi:hypothetical protein